MKKLLFVSKVLIAVLSVVLILVIIGLPLLTNFTTSDASPSVGFFMENLMDFLPLAPFVLMVLVPVIAAENFFRYKLGRMDAKKFKRRLLVFLAVEIILLIFVILIMVSAFYSIRVSLIEVPV